MIYDVPRLIKAAQLRQSERMALVEERRTARRALEIQAEQDREEVLNRARALVERLERPDQPPVTRTVLQHWFRTGRAAPLGRSMENLLRSAKLSEDMERVQSEAVEQYGALIAFLQVVQKDMGKTQISEAALNQSGFNNNFPAMLNHLQVTRSEERRVGKECPV